MGRDPRATPARQPSTLPMSGDGKRSVAEWPKLPRPSSTLPTATLELAVTICEEARLDCSILCTGDRIRPAQHLKSWA